MKKKCIALVCAAALALSLTACGTVGQTGAADTDTNTNAVQAVGAEVSLEGATTLTFTDSGVAASDGDYTGYAIDGTALTIDGAGTYILTGTCGNGSVTVKKGTTGVTLVLNGLDLTSADTAPITCNKSTEVTICAADGSVNVLTDSAENNDESYPDNTEAENAVIKCKDGSRVTLCGTGSLTVNAKGKNGIKSGASTAEEGEASLTIRELALTIDAPVNDAVNAEQLLTIESGTLNIYSGDIAINATDDCLNAANSDLSGYDFSINISGGTITAYTSGGDGFDSNGDLNISGGTVAVWSVSSADNQPLDADGAIRITGGTVLAAGGSGGMGMSLTAEQPCVLFSFGGAGGFGGNSGGSSLTKGSAFTIGSGSTAVYSGEALCNAGFVFFSSSDLTADSSYDLAAGGSTIATAAAQTGSVQTGMGGMGSQSGQPGQMPGGSFDPGSAPTPPSGDFRPGNKQ